MESDFVLRFQQLTGPVMAKGVEDTAFYCFNRLLALNEVGGDPGGFGTSPDAFHAFCARVQSERPLTLLASATHDTKRGEDTRLRIGLLSEMPERWAEAVRRWSRMNAVFRRNGFPDAEQRVLPLPDAGGRLAHRQRPPGPLHAEGRQGSQGAHVMDGPEPGFRGGAAEVCRRGAGPRGASRRTCPPS